MDPNDTIPFNNLSDEHAQRQPFSDFAVFHQALKGYRIFNRITMQIINKWEVYSRHKDNLKDIQKIKNFNHPMYKFILLADWEEEYLKKHK